MPETKTNDGIKELVMKRVTLISILAFLFLSSSHAFGLERKTYYQISVPEITKELQRNIESPQQHVALVWWIPIEYWRTSLRQNNNITDDVRKQVLDALAPCFILGVVQADFSSIGAANFYTKEEVSSNMRVTYKNKDGHLFSLSPAEAPNPNAELILNQLKPILQAAMGNLGTNFHFYIFSDKDKSNKRIADPYVDGELFFELSTHKGEKLKASIETPLNALYVPRLCPNGKPAHVKWNYCPWTGKRLPN